MDKFFKNMSKEKQQFIKQFMDEQKPSDSKKAIPFLMNYVAMAKKKNINFTKEEIIFLYTLYNNSLSEKQKNAIDQILKTLK